MNAVLDPIDLYCMDKKNLLRYWDLEQREGQ